MPWQNFSRSDNLNKLYNSYQNCIVIPLVDPDMGGEDGFIPYVGELVAFALFSACFKTGQSREMLTFIVWNRRSKFGCRPAHSPLSAARSFAQCLPVRSSGDQAQDGGGICPTAGGPMGGV